MALGLFKKQVPQTTAPAAEVTAVQAPATTETAAPCRSIQCSAGINGPMYADARGANDRADITGKPASYIPCGNPETCLGIATTRTVQVGVPGVARRGM